MKFLQTMLALVFGVLSVIMIVISIWGFKMHQAFSYDGKRQMSRQIIEGVASYITIPAGGKGLDVGCGSGALAIAAAKKNPGAMVIGIDRWGKEYASFSKTLCENNAQAESVTNTSFFPGDAVNLNFEDESFDAVFSNYVYHNIPSSNRQEILLETLRTLKKGGVFAIHDIFSQDKYGDINAFLATLKSMGYENVELIDTTKGMFMTPKEAKWMMLSGSALLVGRKQSQDIAVSRNATRFQKVLMSWVYRGKELFKPLNTGTIDEHVACIREYVANIFFYTKNSTTIMIDAGYNYDYLQEKMDWLGIDPQDIQHVLITHQDTDHVGAIEADSNQLFNHARVYIDDIENRYLTGEVRRRVMNGWYKVPKVTIPNKKKLLHDGEVFEIDDIKIETILVPGHTWGHVVYLIDDEYLFTGDTIWFGADGGYSFINKFAEDNQLAVESLAKLEKVIRQRAQS